MGKEIKTTYTKEGVLGVAKTFLQTVLDPIGALASGKLGKTAQEGTNEVLGYVKTFFDFIINPLGTMLSGKLGDTVKKGAEKVVGVVTDFLEGAGKVMFGKNWEPIKKAASKIIGVMTTFFSDVGEWVGDKLNIVWNTVTEPISKLAGIISKGVSTLLTGVSNVFSGLWDMVKEPILGVGSTIKEAFSSITDGISSLYKEEGVFGLMISFFKLIGGAYTTAKGIKVFDKLEESFKGIFGEDGIFGKVQKFIDKIMDSAPVRWMLSKLGFNTSSNQIPDDKNITRPIISQQTNPIPEVEPLSIPQKTIPKASSKDLDSAAYAMSKDDLDEERKYRKESLKQQTQKNNASQTIVTKQESNKGMNTTPSIDEFGVFSINSGLFD
jgi:phage-related protein